MGHPSHLTSIQWRSETWGGGVRCERGNSGRGGFVCQVESEEVENGNGLIRDTVEETTELTLEACHILFSAPMSPRLGTV